MWSPAAPLVITSFQEQILKQWVRAPSTPQGVALRATIVLMAGQGIANHSIATQLAIGRPTVLLWRGRFTVGGLDALTTIEAGRGRKPVIPPKKLEQIVSDTLHTSPVAATHWSTRTMAKQHGVSHTLVQQVWDAHGLKPHLVKTFKLSTDPHFVEKLTDVVGLYLNPPEHAVVFCVDEKTQIQALDRTQLSLPLKRGRAGTVTHDYQRHGTTTLFAALNFLKGEVIGTCVPRHRHQEFLKFLKQIDQATSRELAIHCIVDNYGTHKHPTVKTWLQKHPRFHLHFIPHLVFLAQPSGTLVR